MANRPDARCDPQRTPSRFVPRPQLSPPPQTKYNGTTVRFTTLSEYTDHLHSLNLRFPLKRYPTSFEYGWPHAWTMNLTGNTSVQYQTGAAVSREVFKLSARLTSAQHAAAERAVAYALAYNYPQGLQRQKLLQDLFPAWDAVGIVQHHDAMTGTMSAVGTYDTWGSNDRNATALASRLCTVDNADCQTLEDYTARLAGARQSSRNALGAALGVDPHDPQSLHVTVFNPLSKRRSTFVRVDLTGVASPGSQGVRVAVSGKPSKYVASQLSPQNDSLVFLVTLNPLSSLAFDIQTPCSGGTGAGCAAVPTPFDGAQDIGSGGGFGAATVQFAEATGLPANINGYRAHHAYGLYYAEQGGPYVLIETGEALPVNNTARVSSTTFIGPLVQEVVTVFDLARVLNSSAVLGAGPLLEATARVYSDDDSERFGAVELEHAVPAKIPDNTELIMRVSTGLKTNNTLWTDESGLEMHQRVYNQSLPISGNYHVRGRARACVRACEGVRACQRRQRQ